MAFFDDLSKKITNVSQSAMQKSQDMSNVSKLKNAISDEEKRMNECYFEIGKLYVSKHETDFESDFADHINAIKEATANIALYDQQIKEIKGMTKCPNCGRDVSTNSAFCNFCGTRMPEIFTANRVYCSCGAVIESNSSFCTVCGKPVNRVLNSPVTTEEIDINTVQTESIDNDQDFPETRTVADSSIPPSAKMCPACGNIMPMDMAYCTNCGIKV